MNNKQWLNRVLVVCCLMAVDVNANQYAPSPNPSEGALSWWGQQNNLAPQYAPQPWQQQHHSPFQAVIPTVSPYNSPPPSYQQRVHYQPAAFSTPWKEKNPCSKKLCAAKILNTWKMPIIAS